MLQQEIAVLSRPGGRERNEDACGYWTSDAGCCWVVSDGAGGHGAGDVASKLAVSYILQEFAASPQVTPEHVAELLQGANAAVLTEQGRHSQWHSMRATATVLCLERQAGFALWGHAGDTRLYCYRAGRLLHRTRDHSVIQSMVDAGYADVGALRSHPQRSVLLSALGSDEDFEISVAGASLPVRDGDAFLLCSDGWWEYVEESVMEATLQAAATARDWLAAMEAELLRNARPGHDNYTGLAVWLDDPGEATRMIGA